MTQRRAKKYGDKAIEKKRLTIRQIFSLIKAANLNREMYVRIMFYTITERQEARLKKLGFNVFMWHNRCGATITW